MAHPVTFFQIQGSDGPRLERFYSEVFGWKMSPSPDGSMAMVAPEEGGIPGGVGRSQHGNASVAIYVDTDDIAAHLAKAEKAGSTPGMDPMELPGGMGWIAGFVDPEGNWIGLWQPPAATPAAKVAAKRKPAAKKAAPKKAAPKKAAPKKAAPKKAAPKKAAVAKKPATKKKPAAKR